MYLNALQQIETGPTIEHSGDPSRDVASVTEVAKVFHSRRSFCRLEVPDLEVKVTELETHARFGYLY